MAIEIKCDSCGVPIDRGEEIFCRNCYDELTEEIKELNDRIEELQKEIREG